MPACGPIKLTHLQEPNPGLSIIQPPRHDFGFFLGRWDFPPPLAIVLISSVRSPESCTEFTLESEAEKAKPVSAFRFLL